jgi:hypothetical protein
LLIKNPKQHGQENFLENFQKKLEEKCYEIVKFFERFGQISDFLLLKSWYQLIGSPGWPTCNRIPRFFSSQFVL